MTLLSGGADGNINIWQVASRQLLRCFSAHKSPITSLTMVMVPVKMPSEKYVSCYKFVYVDFLIQKKKKKTGNHSCANRLLH